MTKIEQYRNRLVKIESAIRKIIGTVDADSVCVRHFAPSKLDCLEKLLFKRCCILNNLFQATDEEMYHFDRVNSHLLYLRNELYRRTTSMKHSIVPDKDFDDDYEVEGTLIFTYNSDESVLTLSNDDFYGSDFQLMISTISSFYHAKDDENIGATIDPDNTNTFDDGQSWSFPVFLSDEFSNRIVGYAPYCLCHWKHYSVPDLVRLNDFWAEVHLRAQSITTQSGERYNP